MRRIHALVAAGTVVLASPFVTWWLVGDISEDGPHLDYVLKPPRLTSTQELVIGAGATTCALLAIAAVTVALRRHVLRAGELGVAIPLVAAGMFVGYGFRVVTAGVIGANIGAGLTVLFGLIFLPAM